MIRRSGQGSQILRCAQNERCQRFCSELLEGHLVASTSRLPPPPITGPHPSVYPPPPAIALNGTPLGDDKVVKRCTDGGPTDTVPRLARPRHPAVPPNLPR